MKWYLVAAFSIGSLLGFAGAEGRNAVVRSRLQSDLARAREQSLAWSELAEEREKECHALHKQLEASQ